MADDHAPSRADAFDLDTDEGWDAYMRDLETRRPVPERLRYPETPEAYTKMVNEAFSDFEKGEVFTLDEVRAHIEELKARLVADAAPMKE